MQANHIQALADGMSAAWQKERSATQMTLGKLIARLEAMPPDARIDGLYEPHSYRGYYSDLSLEKRDESTTAGELLNKCRACMGKVFHGYKGGEFVMGELTPLWVAEYGCCGLKLMAIGDDGVIETAEDE